eukprot:TRINITY_DN6018_c0_g1_i1.p1 TRINITY_DN6018_c0_g1~~TRINITY_DN6018_c0_g1_i1.p1  ORF type:complete len:114 (-),score=13.98 TRINITY_DN6018_c0_g1_i1:34-375(-)
MAEKPEVKKQYKVPTYSDVLRNPTSMPCFTTSIAGGLVTGSVFGFFSAMRRGRYVTPFFIGTVIGYVVAWMVCRNNLKKTLFMERVFNDMAVDQARRQAAEKVARRDTSEGSK